MSWILPLLLPLISSLIYTFGILCCSADSSVLNIYPFRGILEHSR